MASRDIPTVVENALDDSVIRPIFAVEFFFDNNETLRLWTGIGDQTLGGNTYTGAGNLLNISAVEETSEIAARGANLNLSGIPSELVATALSEPYQGRVCKIHFAVSDGETYSDLVEVFSGYMDEMNIEEGAETATIGVSVENKLIDLERARIARYTSQYQKSLYPNDKGFDFVESLQTKKTLWGTSGNKQVDEWFYGTFYGG